MKKISLLLASAAIAFTFSTCKKSSSTTNNNNNVSHMSISSTDFNAGDEMPIKYTCDKTGPVHPSITWGSAPSNAAMFVVVMQDNDADWTSGDKFVHWLMYDINSTTSGVAEGTGKTFPMPDNNTSIGQNDYGALQYDGPCPPSVGTTHNYQIKVLACDAKIALGNGKFFTDIRKAIKGHILDSATLSFKYTKQ